MAVTDSSGKAVFDVTRGEYKIRTDYLGYRFWTDTTWITDHTSINQTLPHKDVSITVSGIYQGTASPVTQIKTSLFSPSGQYLMYQKTDDQGQVIYWFACGTYANVQDYVDVLLPELNPETCE